MFETALQAGRAAGSRSGPARDPGDVAEPAWWETGAPDPVLLARADAAHAAVGAAQLAFLRAVSELEEATTNFEAEGARDAAHLLGLRYGLSRWRAERYLGGARALRRLPRLAAALERGELGLDKVLELARFATPQDEAALIAWAKGVSCGAIRHRAETLARAEEERERRPPSRSLDYRFTPEGRFELWADLPAADGAVVASAIERTAERLPEVPGEDPRGPERAADALVAICSGKGVGAVVLVHARAEAIASGRPGAELGSGVPIPPGAASRLACSGALQVLLEDTAGDVVAATPLRREAPAWMMRQLRYRDRECRFPGCGAIRFTQAHHVRWWSRGGRTELANLVLVCSFHHRLVHEHGWGLARASDGTVTWFRPDGRAYAPGPTGRNPGPGGPDPPPRRGHR